MDTEKVAAALKSGDAVLYALLEKTRGMVCFSKPNDTYTMVLMYGADLTQLIAAAQARAVEVTK